MLDIIIETPAAEKLLKNEEKMETELIDDLRRTYPNTIGDGRGSNVWVVSRRTYCDDEWYQRIKSLRVADDDLRHIRFTNSYLEQRLNECFDELKAMRETSEMIAGKLNDLSEIDIEFTRALFACISRDKPKKVKFRNPSKQSKSVEHSSQKASSCGSALKGSHEISRCEKSMRRKDYGKYCSNCGVIEVPSKNSMVRCRECNGEIILQGRCSSCAKLSKELKTWRISGDETCSSCDNLRRRIRVSGISQKAKLRKGSAFYCRSKESRYCSDCDLSSCGTTALTHKENTSADSLIPQSDSDLIRSHSFDYDITSSLSSGSWKPPKIEERDVSLDDEYATPRECLSCSICLDEGSNSEEYVEAPEPEEPQISITDLQTLYDRLNHAEEALDEITTGNLKFQERILTVENISQQNVHLSTALQNILTDMTERLQQSWVIEYDSESSDTFEEAVDDTDTESFYDIQPPKHCYLCLHCGIGMSHRQMTNCPNCERMLAEIPKGFFGGEAFFQQTGNELVPARCICKNWKLDDPFVSAFPVLINGNFPQIPLTSVEDRLRFIESETNLLRNNNEIINLFVDDFKTKLHHELECVQSVYPWNGSIREMTIFGIDVSFYQLIRQVTEMGTSRETLKEEVEEEVCQNRKTLMEMKMEEVFKKEQQTALELEIFEQKLQVEGLIIKETEDFFMCSNAGETQSLPLSQIFTSENYPTAEKNMKKDNLLISIEIELEKKKAIRCEYKANLQKSTEQERTITLYPTCASKRPEPAYSKEFVSEESFFIDIEGDDFLEIKSPKNFSYSSDDDERIEENKLIIGSTVAVVAMPFPMHPITVIQEQETPFVMLNVLNTKKEFSRVSQIELSHSPESGVVFLQTEAVSPLDCHQGESFEEFFEVESCPDKSLQQNVSGDLEKVEKSLVQFVPINMGATSIAGIRLENETLPILVTENAKPVENSTPDFVPELTTALCLIREIENDVVEVKLQNAIAILPKLESVLREHLHDKMILMKKSSTMSSASLDIFMSALNFLREGSGEIASGEVESEERLGKIINMLTGLEEAVREDGETKCEKPDRICDLLRDLASRIEGYADVSAMEDAVQLTSELDVPTRRYSCNMEPPDGAMEAGDYFITADTLKSLKKKIFEMVTYEAQERDSRLEQGMERIAKLEKENTEAMGFLATLLDKTLRRVGELDFIRATAAILRNEIEDFIQKSEEKESLTRIAQTPILPVIQEVSSDCSTNGDGDSVKETLSGMIVALDNLKMKAKEKTEKYKEIFGDERDTTKRPAIHPDGVGVTRSVSTEMPATGEGGKSRITEFSRIGANTYFMTWTKPVDVDEESAIVGYEIWVNGKVNQRVRNPERFKAVLYSVHPTIPGGKLRIKLFALTEDGRRSSLADLRYPEE